MNYPKLVVPTPGTVYLNRNGQQYRCIRVIDPEHAVMERLIDKWTLTACRTRLYEDGSIEWDLSTGGHWPEGKPSHKPVLTAEQFSYDTVRVGDYVAQEVVDEAMNCLPPACMTSECAQLGEPYSHREDPDTGRWRAVYATFRRVSESVWEYRGHCFRGETTERSRGPNGSTRGDDDFRPPKTDKSDKGGMTQ